MADAGTKVLAAAEIATKLLDMAAQNNAKFEGLLEELKEYDLSTIPETVRDTVVTALRPGAHISITADDAADTITISATGVPQHAHPLADLPVADAGVSSASQLVRADDPRLSDARQALNHTHTAGGIQGFDQAVNDRITSFLYPGTGISLNYDDANQRLEISASGSGSGSFVGGTLTEKLYLANPTATGAMFNIGDPVSVTSGIETGDLWLSTNGRLRYSTNAGSALHTVLTTSDVSTVGNFLGLSDAAGYISPNTFGQALAFGAATFSSTITLNLNTRLNWTIAATGNFTLANPTGLVSGKRGTIRVQQDGTGSRTISFGSNWKAPGGAQTLSTSPDAIDYIDYIVISGTEIRYNIMKDVK